MDSIEGDASLSPLPVAYRRGQIAMAVVGMVSLVSSSALFLHITYRLFASTRNRNGSGSQGRHQAGIDLSLGLSQANYIQTKGNTPSNQQPSEATEATQDMSSGDKSPTHPDGSSSPSPLLILIYNLILADAAFAGTYVVNIVWLREDAIIVGSATCNAQGWLASFGCLISSGFLVTLATYTYLILLRGWQPSPRFAIFHSMFIWAATIIVTCLGPIFSGEKHYFSRQQLWCWIHGSNGGWRLSVYLWGFTCIVATFCVYSYTFWELSKKHQSSRFLPPRSSSSMSSRNDTNEDGLRPSGHHPAFLIYPVVYMCCATPMTLGSITPLEHSTPFMIFAGVLLALVGFFDSILWSSTILFSRDEDMINTGLDQFAFMRTPAERSFGNLIWVQGGGRAQSKDQPKEGGWWMLGKGRNNSDSEVPLHEIPPQTREGCIQMDISTIVVVENKNNMSETVSSKI